MSAPRTTSSIPSTPTIPTAEEFITIQHSAEFGHLRSTFRRFAVPVTIAFLAWYLGYIVTATFATNFVETPVYGAINVGMVLGLAQFVTTGFISWAYIRFADNKLDPVAEALSRDIESGAFSTSATAAQASAPLSSAPTGAPA